jgi:hypothetical protein
MRPLSAILLLTVCAPLAHGEEADFGKVLRAAGAIVTTAAVCPEVRVEPQMLAHVLRLEQVARSDASYWLHFDAGVALATAAAAADREAFCASAESLAE